MNLVKISNNILVNADHICSIEQKFVRKEMKIFVYTVDGREYELEDVDAPEFMKEIYNSGNRQQFFAG